LKGRREKGRAGQCRAEEGLGGERRTLAIGGGGSTTQKERFKQEHRGRILHEMDEQGKGKKAQVE